jgi:hypothetical protein
MTVLLLVEDKGVARLNNMFKNLAIWLVIGWC